MICYSFYLRYNYYLVERRKVKFFGDELLQVQDCRLGRAADPLPLQAAQLAAVTLQTDAHLRETDTAGRPHWEGPAARQASAFSVTKPTVRSEICLTSTLWTRVLL